MNENFVPPSHMRIQQSWIVVSLPGAMTPSEANLLVAYLRTHLAATYFVEFTAGAIRIHAFVLRTSDQLAIDLKRKLGGLLIEATAEAKSPDGSRPISESWSPA